MTIEQSTALKLLLKRYAEASFLTSMAYEEAPSEYNKRFEEEQLAEKEIIDYVDSMLINASKDVASTVLDKSFWNG